MDLTPLHISVKLCERCCKQKTLKISSRMSFLRKGEVSATSGGNSCTEMFSYNPSEILEERNAEECPDKQIYLQPPALGRQEHVLVMGQALGPVVTWDNKEGWLKVSPNCNSVPRVYQTSDLFPVPGCQGGEALAYGAQSSCGCP